MQAGKIVRNPEIEQLPRSRDFWDHRSMVWNKSRKLKGKRNPAGTRVRETVGVV